jgi:hypothetical protein
MVTRFTGPSEAPASRSTFADTIVSELPATPPGTLPGIPLEPSPEPASATRLLSLPEPQPAVPPEEEVGGPSEPVPAPAEPFPEFALESRREVEEARSREVEPASGRGAETDSSTLVPEPSPVVAVPTPEPVLEAAAELPFVRSESSRKVEKPSS